MTTATATPVQHFQLDRNIWNPALYHKVHNFWFQGLDQDSKTQNATTKRRWWGVGRSDEEFQAIDAQVHHLFGPAIHSIDPGKLLLPEWKDHEEEARRAETVAAPFLAEIDVETGGTQAADTLLALLLLLDQMPRHMFRSPRKLSVVYRHYDRLAWSLLRAVQRREAAARPHAPATAGDEKAVVGNPWYTARSVRNHWFNMTLVHAEDLPSQDEALEGAKKMQDEAKGKGEEEVVEDLNMAVQACQTHRDIVARFQRFPHRNECLGRETTEEEREWLKTGETFGVKQGDGK